MDFQTPPPIANYMVNMLPFGIKRVLEPTPGKGNIVRALKENGYSVEIPKNKTGDFWRAYSKYQSEGMKFDASVMNPPFTPMDTGYKILYAVMELTDQIIAIMPWLTLINSEKRTRTIWRYGLRSVTHLPRWVFPGSRVQTCIIDMQKGWLEETKFLFYGE